MGNRRHIDREPFPNFFRQWREFRSLTQAEVERLHGWPASRVSNLENNRATITGHLLATLAKTYRCSIADLLSRDPLAAGSVVFLHGGLPAAGGTAAAIQDALSALERLGNEVQAIRADLLPRLDALEVEIGQGRARVIEILQNAGVLAETFEHFADSLRQPSAAETDKDREPAAK